MHTLTNRVARYVAHQFRAHLPATYTYHNLQHTQGVVRAVQMIGLHEGLSTEEQQLVTLAAWFHDLGHVVDYQQHEYHSERLARAFLAVHDVPPAAIATVVACIRATTMPQAPHSTVEAVLCDADLYYLSTSAYAEGQHRLRHEWAVVLHQHYSDAEWVKLNGRFFSLHEYHTEYGKTVLEPRKREQFAGWFLRSKRPISRVRGLQAGDR